MQSCFWRNTLEVLLLSCLSAVSPLRFSQFMAADLSYCNFEVGLLCGAPFTSMMAKYGYFLNGAVSLDFGTLAITIMFGTAIVTYVCMRSETDTPVFK